MISTTEHCKNDDETWVLTMMFQCPSQLHLAIGLVELKGPPIVCRIQEYFELISIGHNIRSKSVQSRILFDKCRGIHAMRSSTALQPVVVVVH